GPSDVVAADATEPAADADGVDAPDGGAPVDALAGPVLPPAAAAESTRFITSQRCGQCHSSDPSTTTMTDARGRAIGPFDLWQSSMMANSARDPIFRAVLSRERARAPNIADEIAGECLTCHAPMLATEAHASGDHARLETLYEVSNDGALGRDGISCALCHQIAPEGLGTDAQFSGGYVIGTARQIFGPHAAPFTRPMQNEVRFTPVEAPHMDESKVCSPCHVLVTNRFDEDGTPSGYVANEQLTYVEWQRSAYSTEGGGTSPTSCQACHMPSTDEDGAPITTRIARRPIGGDFPPITARAPYHRHVLVGGNTLGPMLLDAHRDELAPPASPAAFEATISAARRQLEERTADLELRDVRFDSGRVSFDVVITQHTGHKLPTGIPVRRAWLAIDLSDGTGASIVTLGRVDASGRIVDGAGVRPEEVAGGPVWPHRDRVESPSDVVVFESVLADADGGPAWALLAAAGFYKDNRLLPAGWADTADAPFSTVPVGVDGDRDFGPGGDVVHVSLGVEPGAPQPARVTVALRYQPLGARFLAELVETDTPEIAALERMLAETPLVTETIAEVTAALP
ncbi:hypothetical protein L6R52_24850, partial [Myxococcota bacterium]|nr:hypothetical protein [Myxococcota bacterium]